MSVNLLRIFEGNEIRQARQTTDALKQLVRIAKADKRKAQDRLRDKLAKEMEDLDPSCPCCEGPHSS